MFIVPGAYQYFKRDQLRLIQHSRTSGTSEALYKDLLLAVQLEVHCFLSYIVFIGFY